jgi:hypothetical protein
VQPLIGRIDQRLPGWKGKMLNRAGMQTLVTGHCLVNWLMVCKPKDLGDMGVLDLDTFGRALSLWWLW